MTFAFLPPDPTLDINLLRSSVRWILASFSCLRIYCNLQKSTIVRAKSFRALMLHICRGQPHLHQLPGLLPCCGRVSM